MKIRLTMKDPDTLNDAIEEAVKDDIARLGLSAEEAEAVKDIRIEKAAEVCSKWFRYSELLTVEIDTEAQTCVVAEVAP